MSALSSQLNFDKGVGNDTNAKCVFQSIDPHQNMLINTLGSLLNDPVTYKEVKFIGKIVNASLKLSGLDHIAVISSLVKKIARFEGIFEYALNSKLVLNELNIIEKLSTNKGHKEMLKPIWAALAVLDHVSNLGYAIGMISSESVVLIALAQQISKYTKQFLSAQHGILLGLKVKNKPDSDKALVWKLGCTKGMIKTVALASRVSDTGKQFNQIASLVTGGLSLTKRKHFGPIKELHKIQKRALKGDESSQKARISKIEDTSVDYRKVILLSLRFLVLLSFLTELYNKYLFMADESVSEQV